MFVPFMKKILVQARLRYMLAANAQGSSPLDCGGYLKKLMESTTLKVM